MSAEKTQPRDLQDVPPQYNPNEAPTIIEPDHVHTAPAAQQPVQPQVQPQPQPQSQYPYATPLYSLQRTPAPVDCPSCNHREMTRVQFESGGTTHGWAALLCLCFCLGCVPYMMTSLKDCRHFCGRCNTALVTWHNSGRLDILAGPNAIRK